MAKKKRFLIMSEDERTWRYDQPVLFLGNWCTRHRRRVVWEKMDAVTLAPWAKSQSQLDKCYSDALKLERMLFDVLVPALNKFHKQNYSARFWQVLLGSWLRRYVQWMYNRIATVKHCFTVHQIESTASFDEPNYVFARQSSALSYWATSEPVWNTLLYMKIIKCFEIPLDLEFVVKDTQIDNETRISNEIIRNGNPLKKTLKEVASAVSSRLVRKNDALFMGTYMSRTDEIKTSLRFQQFPQFWKNKSINYFADVDNRYRNIFRKLFAVGNQQCDFSRAMVYCLPDLIPACYLEGFKTLKKVSDSVSWPENPKFIFTSNSYDTDEVFKIWAAEKVSSGVPYIIGQHGNNYGVHRYKGRSFAEQVSDKFITWGWQHEPQKQFQACMFKRSDFSSRRKLLRENLLYIQPFANHRMELVDQYATLDSDFNFHKKFVLTLNNSIKEHTIIRLHSQFRYFNWDEDVRWTEAFPDIAIDEGNDPIRALLKNCRLLVFAYDSSGFLEALANNVPAIALWPSGLQHVNELAVPFYQSLVDVGVLHFNSHDAAKKVNEIWDDVDKWWLGGSLQEAVSKFCDQYSRKSDNIPADVFEAIRKGLAQT